MLERWKAMKVHSAASGQRMRATEVPCFSRDLGDADRERAAGSAHAERRLAT
jgi:hypothetical protein